LNKVETLAFVAGMETPNGELIMNVKRTKNDKWAQKLSMSGMDISEQYYSDGKGYSGGMGQGMEVEGEELEIQKAEAMFYPEAYAAKNAELTGVEEIAGEKAYVVDWGNDVTKFYSMDTGLLIAKKSVGKGPQGQEVASTEIYADYKEVEGIMLPMTIKLEVMGQNLQMDVKEYMVNKGVTGDDFKWN
jgi:hypothetical protein